MATPVGQCLCESVYAKACCGLCTCRSMSTPDVGPEGDGMKNLIQREHGREPGQDLGREFNEKKRHKEISSDVSAGKEKAVNCFRCVGSESVVRCRCTSLSLHTTSSSANSIELDDGMKKLPELKLGLCSSAADGVKDDQTLMKMTLLHQEHGRVPKGVAHLRNGLVPYRGAQLRRCWVPKGAAPSKHGWVSKGFAHLRNGRVPKGITLLRKKNHLETNGEGSTFGGAAKADRPVSPDDFVTHIPAHDIIDATEVAASIAPHFVDIEVVAEEAVVLGDDGEGVDNVVTGGITGPGGDGENVDKVVARATVDLGVDGDPIELGVLSPAGYANLVFNVLLSLPLVDADFQ